MRPTDSFANLDSLASRIKSHDKLVECLKAQQMIRVNQVSL